MAPAPDPGSFRDPSNRVFLDSDRVLRGLSAGAAAEFAALQGSELFRQGMDSGQIVATRLLDGIPEALADQGWSAVLEHDRVPVLSYPYEWPFHMLKDAALLQLDLTLAAMEEGFITKDATPYNVQFVGSRPVHIDIGSFEPLAVGEPWFGHRQFREQFLHPLVLTARRGIPHQSALRGSLRGISASTCAASLRRGDLLRPSLLIHIGLQASAERKRSLPSHDVRSELKTAGFGPKIVAAQLKRLRKLVASLEWGASSSLWSEYSERSHYADEELQAKTEFVRRVAVQQRRRQVLDLGANDGHFTDVVLPFAEYAVSVDHDPLVVDRLYRSLRQRGEQRVLPLVLDLTDLPGGLGWRARERSGFVARVAPDLILCLALIHHLVISESIPVEEVLDFLADFDAETVLELPTPNDDMVRLLASQKKDPRLVAERYSVDRFDAALHERFSVVDREEIGTRLLYHLRPR